MLTARQRFAILVTTAALLLASCGSAAPSRSDQESAAPVTTSRGAESARPAEAVRPAATAAPKAAAPALASGAAPAAGAAGEAKTTDKGAAPAGGARVANAAGQLPPVEEKIIRTGRMEIVVTSVSEAGGRVQVIVSAVGGLVQQSAFGEQGATLVLRVPVDQFDRTMRELRALAIEGTRVIESSEAQDVTEQYADNEARIKNLKITEEQVQRLLAKAEKLEDIIIIQRELTAVREQIERLQGVQNVLGRRAAFSTIALTLRPREKPPVPALVRPLPNALRVAVRPLFQWSASPIALTYDLQITLSDDTKFDAPVHAFTRLDAPMFEWTEALPPLTEGTRYRWRVRASNIAGDSEWSEARVFETVPPAPVWTPLLPAAKAWEASLVNLQRAADGLIWVVVYNWWLILLAIVVIAVVGPRLQRGWAARGTGRPAKPPAGPTPPAPPADPAQ